MVILFRIKKWPALSASIATTIISMTVFFTFAAASWPGATSGCFDTYLEDGFCFCERPRGDQPGEVMIAQPVNTWSNLGFILVGLFIGWSADSKQFPSTQFWQNNNFITEEVIIQASFVSVLSFLGPGSMLMHASFTQWGGTVDVFSMVIFVLWSVTYMLIARLFYPRRAFVATASIVYVITIVVFIVMVTRYRSYFPVMEVFMWLLYLTFALEGATLILYLVTKQRYINYWLLFASILLFGVGYAMQTQSISGGRLCFPNSFFQGHAVWHLLVALSIGVAFFYFGSERSERSPVEAISSAERMIPSSVSNDSGSVTNESGSTSPIVDLHDHNSGDGDGDGDGEEDGRNSV